MSPVVTCSTISRCLQHPYLVSRDIEPTGLPLTEAHERLIGASAKLRFLQSLLPKLKARGHRILLFSQVGIFPVLRVWRAHVTHLQFVIALDIIEDFLVGEGVKFLRLVSLIQRGVNTC